VLAFWSGGRNYAAYFGPEGEVGEAEAIAGEPSARRVGGTPRQQWDALVAEALGAIGRGVLKKVVVARTIEVESDRPIEVRRVLKSLEARFPTCRTFSFRGDGDEVFVGSTPELLAETSGGRFFTEALAGTAAGDGGSELLRSQKDRAEHQAVVDGIREALGAGVEIAPEPQVRRLSNLAHLCTPISVALAEGDEGLSLARALHPTAAVSGAPRVAALEFLRRHEGLERGWYAGAVGHRGPSGMHLSVALRCARIRGQRATLYVGAGVVEGSTAEAEWLETERKALAMLGALGVAR
jgi:isochorismate synthase